MDGLVSPEPRMAGGDLGSVGGSAHPCALSRIWGRSLERKFASLLT
ncbi:hypothetical protein [Desulfosporosinus burensis]